MNEFLTDVETLRKRAREGMEKGSVTDAYGADLDRVLFVLNQALATEMVCVLRYTHDHFMARGLRAKTAAAEFREHADQELEHANRVATVGHLTASV